MSEGYLSWSAHMAGAAMQRNPATGYAKWAYEWGLLLKALVEVWCETQDQTYLDYVQATIDHFVMPDGEIRTYDAGEYNLDRINPGKVLFLLYALTGDERYATATRHLRAQLSTHPRTTGGGFWHKQIYPHQMWLDGIYMASPFLAEFATVFGESALFDDAARQILLLEAHARDPQTGLLYHAWDESKLQRWANPHTGCSPHFWGRALGWYVMAIPDVLDHLPADHPQRGPLIGVLARALAAVIAVQDPATGLWYQVLDRPGQPGNYLEASASCMFVYAIAKAVCNGYLPGEAIDHARRAYEGILDRFVTTDDACLLSLDRICSVAGLGGEPYRDGTFEYYVSEPVVADDLKGVGPFILAGIELAHAG